MVVRAPRGRRMSFGVIQAEDILRMTGLAGCPRSFNSQPGLSGHWRPRRCGRDLLYWSIQAITLVKDPSTDLLVPTERVIYKAPRSSVRRYMRPHGPSGEMIQRHMQLPTRTAEKVDLGWPLSERDAETVVARTGSIYHSHAVPHILVGR